MRALITGASSGFGAEFARQLAAKGYDLILAARSTDKMIKLGDELSKEYGINYEVYTVDLGDLAGIEDLCKNVIEKEDFDLLINNAGRGNLNGLLASDDIDQSSMMVLNMTTIVLQSKRLINKWIKQNQKGKIINVCSTSSFLFDGTWPLYAATKAFVRSISYGFDAAIEEAGKKDDIHIQCLCPGLTKTSFMGDKFSMEDLDKMGFMNADEVVKISLESLEKNEFLVIPGEHNQETVKYFQTAPVKEIRERNTSFKNKTGLKF